MSIINTQAVADARKARTGKDGALYNSNGKLLASVETYQSQMAVANQKYHRWERRKSLRCSTPMV